MIITNAPGGKKSTDSGLIDFSFIGNVLWGVGYSWTTYFNELNAKYNSVYLINFDVQLVTDTAGTRITAYGKNSFALTKGGSSKTLSKVISTFGSGSMMTNIEYDSSGYLIVKSKQDDISSTLTVETWLLGKYIFYNA